MLRWVEARDGRWGEIIEKFKRKVKEVGVKKGQIVWIDAHFTPEPDGYISELTAYWDDGIVAHEPIDIDCYFQSRGRHDWSTHYENAADFVTTIHAENLISMTGTANDMQSTVFFVWYYVDNTDRPVPRKDIKYICSNGAWKNCPGRILDELKNVGVKQGQIISIDAQNNTHSGHSQKPYPVHGHITAFWDAALPERGDLHYEWDWRWTFYWEDHYIWATKKVNSMKGNINVKSITSVVGWPEDGVTFLIYEEDGVHDIDFDMTKAKITSAEPITISTLINDNATSVEQKMTFTYRESHAASTSTTSSFTNEVGVELKIGTEFQTSIPAIVEGKISKELTTSYKHTWGHKTTIAHDFCKSAAGTVEVVAPPFTKVRCEFSVTETTLVVPYVLTMLSGRKCRGKWNGSECWGLRSHLTMINLPEQH